MSRKEFSRAVKASIMLRVKEPTGFRCEECGWVVPKGEIDHTVADALVVVKRKLTPEDGMFLCKNCHAEKTGLDVPAIAKAKRVEARNLGVSTPPKRRLQWTKREKPPSEKTPLKPRELYK